MPVLTSGFRACRHAQVPGDPGRRSCQRTASFVATTSVALTSTRWKKRWSKLDGAPALVVVNAGEVNAGEFDPVKDMIDLSREHNTWVHVDGAFGLFAAISPKIAHFVDGIERADSALPSTAING